MSFYEDVGYYIFKSLLSVICTIIMMLSCTTVKASARKLATTAVIYLACVTVGVAILVSLLPVNLALIVGIVVICLTTMVILYRISDFTPWQAVFNYTMQLSLALVLMMTQTLVVHSRLEDFVVRLGSFAAVIFLEWKYLRPKFAQLDHLPDATWRLLSLAPLGFSALNLFLGTWPVHFLESPTSVISVYISTVVMIVMYVIIFHSLIGMRELRQAQEKNDILVTQTKALQSQLDAINDAEEQMHIQRHNMRFHLTHIDQLLASGDVDEARTFIDGVNRKIYAAAPPRYCENKTVNAVLSYYIQRARENDIQVEVSFVLPEKLAIDVTDFTTMLANALDNAIRACAEVSEPLGRRLTITARSRTLFILEIANTFEGTVLFDENGLPTSDRPGHGVGTRSIAAFAEKSGAMLSYSVSDNWFRLRIATNLSP